MQLMTNQLPSLGYVHKIICDCLGIWSGDKKDITFQVSAREKDRRAALKKAFESIKNGNGTIDELISATSKVAPENEENIKKSRTIQAYVNDVSKTDFESIDEYIELRQYILIILKECYSNTDISELAVNFYLSALTHYREFIREYTSNDKSQKHSYHCFLNQDLRLLLNSLICEFLPEDVWPASENIVQWPLKSFADTASTITGISLYQLHQYHEFQKNQPLKEQKWERDFTSLPINTQSKQVIDRLSKRNKMKWKVFYPTLQPLISRLPKTISEKSFAIHAFSAMIIHNLNAHIAENELFVPLSCNYLADSQVSDFNLIPSSDFLDLRLNDYSISHDSLVQQAENNYQILFNDVRNTSDSLNSVIDIPSFLQLIYQYKHRKFIESTWYIKSANNIKWIEEWIYAKEAMFSGNYMQALTHFSKAVDQAKYAAGALFIPFYIQVCAFCKMRYRMLSEQKKEIEFDQFYDDLGQKITKYAELLGYTPYWIRHSKTLIPQTMLPLKSKLIIGEIDNLAKNWYVNLQS